MPTAIPDDAARERRRLLRAELLARRLAMSAAERAPRDGAITALLSAVLTIDRAPSALPASPASPSFPSSAVASPALPATPPPVLGFCWPHRGEFDARPLAARFIAQGGRAALPVVAARGAALQFRRWEPGAAMAAGDHGIPVPAAGEPLSPDLMLVPLVGFDEAGYRLGYGGGYFDRTLAGLARAHTIGVGYESARVRSIEPQPHDLPMRWIVTEAGVFESGAERLQPVAAHDVRAALGLG
ncbi:MAG TPA: 5-formyltetrahydrofolate cyclo-ligase [Burkholderiaceae bacterium]|nr:5-formyltetrahydrofolate cyclo-ligase [Burkholderiaceae bacterium]